MYTLCICITSAFYKINGRGYTKKFPALNSKSEWVFNKMD